MRASIIVVTLAPIPKRAFPLWHEMRDSLYSLEEDYDLQEMEQLFVSDEWYCYFLKDPDDHILGFIELSSRNIVDGCLSSPVAYLEGLYLKPEYRGQGIGREVIASVRAWCREKGFSELATDTEWTNTNAQSFYSALGFEEIDRVVEYRMSI